MNWKLGWLTVRTRTFLPSGNIRCEDWSCFHLALNGYFCSAMLYLEDTCLYYQIGYGMYNGFETNGTVTALQLMF